MGGHVVTVVVVYVYTHHTHTHTVLLTAKGSAKVGDFGLAKMLKDEDDVQEFSKLPCSPACM